MSARSKFGITLEAFASFFGRVPEPGEDLTLFMAKSLAQVWRAYSELVSSGAETHFYNRELVMPHIQRAWRELLVLRSIQPDVDETIFTRYGKITTFVTTYGVPKDETSKATEAIRSKLARKRTYRYPYKGKKGED